MKRATAAFVGSNVLAVVLVGASAFQQGMPDPDHYRVYAEKYSAAFFNSGPLPDAFRPPFYPILLAPIVHSTAKPQVWVALVHALLTVVVLVGVWRIVERTGGAVSTAMIACLLTAVDPILVFQSGQIMTETLFTAVLVWTLLPWLVDRPKSLPTAAGNGVLAALGFLTRPTMGPLFLAVGFSLALRRSWPDFRRWLAAALVFVAVATGWTATGWLIRGEWVTTTTHGGYTLWLANNPSFYETEVVGGRNWAGSVEFDRWQQENAERTRTLDAASKDGRFRDDALHWMHENPVAALSAAVYRLRSFWALAPRAGPTSFRPLTAIYYGGLFFFAAWGWVLIRGWRGAWLTATLVVVVLSAIHTIYWSNMRFRAPIEPLLAIWAATSIDQLWRSHPRAT